MEIKKALVLTVGVGDKNDFERSLLIPLTKSIHQGQWQKVVLLPSTETGEAAEKIMARNPGIPISIDSLSKNGLENDADKCFNHFDKVLQNLKNEGFTITADFTRGTKAMSAALVLAAVRHDVRQLRYVYGNRDNRGTVEAGTEKINEVSTLYATGRAMVDKGRELIAKGSYSASLAFLPEEALVHKDLHNEVKGLKKMAEFFASWDRFDYKKASDHVNDLDSIAKEVDFDGKLSTITNWADTKSWVRRLKSIESARNYGETADFLKYLIVDLYANCERRVYQELFEDAMVRIFSILETIGQRYLFKHGIDAAKVTPQILLDKGLSKGLVDRIFLKDSKNPNSSKPISYHTVLDILRELGDDIANDLKNFDRTLTGNRNESILIHGHMAKAGKNAKEFYDSLDRLKKLICKDDPELTNDFKLAAFLEIRR